MKEETLSIVIPTLNEEGNIRELVERICRALEGTGVLYEIIFIDDWSTDNTREAIGGFFGRYPVCLFTKKGAKGKAQSLLEGISYANYDLVMILDADLQYPPEALPEMMEKIRQGYDIVVANRAVRAVGWTRRFISKGFHLFFSKFLHGFDCDVQSGMKLFRKKIIQEIRIDPSPWTFDLEFLVSARYYGYSIGSVNISFAERRAGKTKIIFGKAICEIGFSAIRLKFKEIPPLPIFPQVESSMVGAGVACRRNRFITHTTLGYDFSAVRTFFPWQRNFIITAAIVFLFGLFAYPISVGVAVVSFLSIVYFLDAVFSFYLIKKSLGNPPEISSDPRELKALDAASLPVYSILCPLYKEAHMLPIFFGAIEKLDWPKDKLDVLLLLEEDDKKTIFAAKAMNLPPFARIVVVPDSLPKTKPKACNYGLCFAAGEYVVIYDAEDIPEPMQLKKAFLGFQKVPSDVWCLQAKLNYFNPGQNLLTRLFTAEYSLWFDVILPGLQSINTFIPLGGTSNHFRTKDLFKLKGWDPFNVTEDCDLGVRIFKEGHGTAIIDSITLEEANSDLKNWIRQRSRWVKGYIQTYLVHMRRPGDLVREIGVDAFIFQIIAGAKTIFLFINPFLWFATFLYFAFNSVAGPIIERLYLPFIFYTAVFSFVFGNFFYFYCYMIGVAKRGQWMLMKYIFLIPFYWALMSVASSIAIYQLIVKPHFWEKTHHGLHLKKDKEEEAGEEDILPDYSEPEKPVPIIPPQFSKPFNLNLAGVRAEMPANPEGEIQAINPAASLSQMNSAVANPPIDLASPEVGVAGNRTKAAGLIPRELVSFLSSGKGIFVLSILLSNFLNFLFNAFLGRVLNFESLGLVAFVGTLWYVIAIFIDAFSAAINHGTAYLAARESKDSSAMFLRSMTKKGVSLIVYLALIWSIAVPFLSRFFNIEDRAVLSLFAPVLIPALISSANGGFLKGSLYFKSLAVIVMSESLSKLALAVIFFLLKMPEWIYAAIPISVVVSFAVSILIMRNKAAKAAKKEEFVFPKRFFAASLLSNVSSAVFLSLDIILAKHFLPPALAGEYVLLSLVGKMVYFLGSLPNMFTLTFVARSMGFGENPKKIFRIVYLAAFILGSGSVLALGIFGGETIPFLFGNKSAAIIPFALTYAITMALFAITGVIVTYRLAQKKYHFAVFSLFFSLVMALGIVFFHSSIGEIVGVIYRVSVICWIAMELLHHFEKNEGLFKANLFDFLGDFGAEPLRAGEKAEIGAEKKILIFNWRDTRHKFAGGAEVYIQEIAKNWIAKGHSVTIFCGNDRHSPRREIVDGVEIIRRGGFYLVYVWAFIYYMFRFRNKYDLVVDCQNGIPFFTPLYAKEPVYCLMHHVHQEVFRKSLIKPLAILASFLEKKMMPVVYEKTPFVTVSDSSKKEIESLGLGKAGVWVVHPGVDLKKLASGAKSHRPVILYLGRLKAYKSIDVLIRAFCAVVSSDPRAVLVVAGSGEEEKNLKDLSAHLGLSGDKIIFTGKISEREKIRLLQQAWVLANPSFMEGWGIVIIEANACGTPVIASNVPGLRDSVNDLHTGYLVPYGDPLPLAEHIFKIINDRSLREKMGFEARLWAESFSWERSSDDFIAIINHDYRVRSSARGLVLGYEASVIK